MVDFVVFVSITLLAVLTTATSYFAVVYFRQLRKAQREYESAKGTVEDIVLSFNRELKREAERIETVFNKVEVSSSHAEAGLLRIDNLEKRVIPLESKSYKLSQSFDELTDKVAALSEANARALEKLNSTELEGIGTKIEEVESAQGALKTKMATLEEQMQKLAIVQEIRPEIPMPVMPIKRDKALAALTETEVAVLEFLSAEGSKTAPEIKERVKLSREHTARLMKRLYEEGYLERETGKLPFKYSVKKEMEKILRKLEPPST